MTQQTKIEWTDFTVNRVWGCTKISPACDYCYAETWAERFPQYRGLWGARAGFKPIDSWRKKLRKINKDAFSFKEENGRHPRVFFSSMCDVFDNQWDPAWRLELFNDIADCTDIRGQILTKRIGNAFQMIPASWLGNWPSHVGLMITVVNQDEANRDIPKLLDLKARLGIPWVGLSIEPMLGPIDLNSLDINGEGEVDALRPTKWSVVLDQWRDTEPEWDESFCDWFDLDQLPNPNCNMHETIDWVICGGESGSNARPMHPDWARSLRDQCKAAGTAFLFKQWGEWTDTETVGIDGNEQLRALYRIKRGECDKTHTFDDNAQMYRLGKKAAGRLLDGDEHNGFPEALT